MARRQHLTAMLALAVIIFLLFTYTLSSSSTTTTGTVVSDGVAKTGDKSSDGATADLDLSSGVLTGGAIAPKLENATAKAELGRAAWKVLHTTMARFPDTPTADESLALKTYVQLFARLYPCGDCARHFQQLLAKYPPQVGSRNAAAGWACFVHNEVNHRLKKPEFDCNKIGDFYDCGCGDEGKEKKGDAAPVAGGDVVKEEKKAESKGKEDERQEELKGREKVSLEKEEGLTRGG